MKHLNEKEINSVSGGNPVLIGVGIGIGANYVYDSIGGAEGINNYLSNSFHSIKASVSYNIGRLRRTFALNDRG